MKDLRFIVEGSGLWEMTFEGIFCLGTPVVRRLNAALARVLLLGVVEGMSLAQSS